MLTNILSETYILLLISNYISNIESCAVSLQEQVLRKQTLMLETNTWNDIYLEQEQFKYSDSTLVLSSLLLIYILKFFYDHINSYFQAKCQSLSLGDI